MELFLISNFAVTLIVVLFNRYSKVSISAKLILSTFALVCWVIPFTLVRHYLPQEIAVNVHWLMPLQISISQVVSTPMQASWVSHLTLNNILIFTSIIGLYFLVIRLFKHHQWINNLKNDPQVKLISEYQGNSVYQSNKISNALLIGYKNPSIWVNSKLVNTPYFEIILEHEATHIRNKDNYWLAIMELIKAIYWWNPLLRILVENIKEYIESRCDYKTSQFFTEGIYQKKLTGLIFSSLMQNQQPVTHTGFVSAVISKNSNIRRLQILKEKQTMNIFSKFIVGILLMSGITILTFPISAVKTLASIEKSDKKNDVGVTFNFNQIPVQSVAAVIAHHFKITPIVAKELKNELVSIELISVPSEQVLDILTSKLNINFIIKDGQLILTSLPGGIFQPTSISTEQQPINSDSKTLLKVSFQENNNPNISHELISSNGEWNEFEIDSYHFNMRTSLLRGNKILIETKIFGKIEKKSNLIANPKIITQIGKLATIQLGNQNPEDEFIGFRLEILTELL